MSSSNLTGDCAINGVGHGIARFPFVGVALAAATGFGAYCYEPCDGTWQKLMIDGEKKWECVIEK